MGNEKISRRAVLNNAAKAGGVGAAVSFGAIGSVSATGEIENDSVETQCADGDYTVIDECTCVDLNNQCEDPPNSPALYYQVNWEKREYCDGQTVWYAASANCGYTADCSLPKCNSDQSRPCDGV
ncbi:hypothetical protein [Halorussus pelagicus]|uniref:hypothetical protein n=1 Tax=Halorussus pelagicus TaxID=2505977 RepID=UPI000FFBB358|nr:hypothetical protein [Halorussus pelagicus]